MHTPWMPCMHTPCIRHGCQNDDIVKHINKSKFYICTAYSSEDRLPLTFWAKIAGGPCLNFTWVFIYLFIYLLTSSSNNSNTIEHQTGKYHLIALI